MWWQRVSFSLSEWSFTICLTPYNRKMWNCSQIYLTTAFVWLPSPTYPLQNIKTTGKYTFDDQSAIFLPICPPPKLNVEQLTHILDNGHVWLPYPTYYIQNIKTTGKYTFDDQSVVFLPQLPSPKIKCGTAHTYT